jgi:hypothetical protein
MLRQSHERRLKVKATNARIKFILFDTLFLWRWTLFYLEKKATR